MPKVNRKINIIKKTWSHNVDGHQIAINDENGDVSIVFFQVFPFPIDKDGGLEAEVVSNVRLTLGQAEMLRKTLVEVIEEFKNRR